MIRSVVYPFLYHLWPILDVVFMIGRPKSSKVLSIYRKFDHFRVKMLDSFVYFRQMVMKLLHKVSGIIKILIEVLLSFITRHRDIFG